jgi:hypothetical protein
MGFTFSHFHTNIRGRPGEILLSEIITNSETSPFVTTELLSREGAYRYGAELPVARQVTKVVPAYPAVRIATEEAEPRATPQPQRRRRTRGRNSPGGRGQKSFKSGLRRRSAGTGRGSTLTKYPLK